MGAFFGWIIFSFIICAIANSKGRSGCAWFFISLLLSPLIAIIILLLVGDSEEKQKENIKKAMDIIEEHRTEINNNNLIEEEAVVIEEESQRDKAISELKKYKDLLDLQVISQEEYEAKKAELLTFLMAEAE